MNEASDLHVWSPMKYNTTTHGALVGYPGHMRIRPGVVTADNTSDTSIGKRSTVLSRHIEIIRGDLVYICAQRGMYVGFLGMRLHLQVMSTYINIMLSAID